MQSPTFLIGQGIGVKLHPNDMNELLSGLTDADPTSVMCWIRENVKADPEDGTINWK